MSTWPARVLIYGAGEAVNGQGSLSSFLVAQLERLEQVCTNRVVSAIAQLDSTASDSIRYVLDPTGTQPRYQLPNVNVGDPNELRSFVGWAGRVCPARRTVLVLSGHGAAWQDQFVEDALQTRTVDRQRVLDNFSPAPGAIRHARKLFGTGVSSRD